MKLLQEQTKNGIANARNLGAQHALGDILIFGDADMIVPPNWFHIINANFTRLPLDALSGILLPNPYEAYPQDWIVFLGLAPWWGFLGGTTNNLCIKRGVFNELGGFKNIIHEDLELWGRVTQNLKYEFRVDPLLISYTSMRRIHAGGPFPFNYLNFLHSDWLQSNYQSHPD